MKLWKRVRTWVTTNRRPIETKASKLTGHELTIAEVVEASKEFEIGKRYTIQLQNPLRENSEFQDLAIRIASARKFSTYVRVKLITKGNLLVVQILRRNG